MLASKKKRTTGNAPARYLLPVTPDSSIVVWSAATMTTDFCLECDGLGYICVASVICVKCMGTGRVEVDEDERCMASDEPVLVGATLREDRH